MSKLYAIVNINTDYGMYGEIIVEYIVKHKNEAELIKNDLEKYGGHDNLRICETGMTDYKTFTINRFVDFCFIH